MEAKANWKLLVENYCEIYHLPHMHPDLNSYSRTENHYTILAGDLGTGQGMTRFEFTARAGIDLPIFNDWPESEKKCAEYIALFPNAILGLQIDYFFSVILLLKAVDRTLEQLQIYCVAGAPISENHLKAEQTLLDGWQAVFFEDIDPVEGMQRGRFSSAFDGGTFSPALERGSHHFHKWVTFRLNTS